MTAERLGPRQPAPPLTRVARPLKPRKLLAVVALAAIGLLAAGCGNAVQSDAPAPRPNIASVQQMEPDGPSRADQYRATATALAAESAARQAGESSGPETEQYGAVVQRLRMPAAQHIRIDSLGIDAPIEEVGTELRDDGVLIWKVIDDIVGHHRASANPGEPGNIVLTGHVESRNGGNVFLNLAQIQVGDEVVVSSPAGEFRYVVATIETRHESETSVLGIGYEEKLTLITCVNDGIFDHRVIVTAYPVEMIASS